MTLLAIKEVNYPLYKFVSKNFDLVEESLKKFGVILINTKAKDKDSEWLKSFLLYHYGEIVNVSNLPHGLYETILSLKGDNSIESFLSNLGFKVKYNYWHTDFSLSEELEKRANSAGIVRLKRRSSPEDEALYKTLLRKATDRELTVAEYVKLLGFTYLSDIDDLIKELRKQGKGYHKIAKELGIHWTTVYNKVKKWDNDDTKAI